jgi:hypothetical protein
MQIRKAIFAINLAKTRAFLIEEIPLDNAPTADTFDWWNGVSLVVCTTSEDVVDWFIDGNPYIRIVEEEPNEYHIMKVEHSPHFPSIGGNIAGVEYTVPVCPTKPILSEKQRRGRSKGMRTDKAFLRVNQI